MDKNKKKNIIIIICAAVVLIMIAALCLYMVHKLKLHEDAQNQSIANITTPKNASGQYFDVGLVMTDVDNKYEGQLNNEKRYLAIGFDDFRDSDFSLVIPLLKEYGVRATFNRIGNTIEPDWEDVSKLNAVLYDGNEIGDHTWFHCNYIYSDPMFNGQNPDSIEGNQIPFPSNAQMRDDRGDGKNVFGFALSESVNNELSDWNSYHEEKWTAFDTTWGELSDEQCQIIREHFSIMSDTSGMLDMLDRLSNMYLGTEGSSKGSWNDEQGCYMGGIFTGARTSANHEIWERVLDVTQKYYKSLYGFRTPITTWSWPGSIPSPFKFEKDGLYYYDFECTKKYNYLARMESSMLLNDDGTYKDRSWDEVLREYGYIVTHDNVYPSRFDGQEQTMMSKQFIYNASLSRKDAIVYPTNYSVDYDTICTEFDGISSSDGKSVATKMYESGGSFFDFIESIRQNTSNGMIQGEVIDSADTYSERIFLESVLDYCKNTGVEVIPKAEAYDICFNYKLEDGNLIYNPYLRNTAKEFMPEAENVPNNPDGYVGECHVIEDSDTRRVLVTDDITTYLHYGIQLGDIVYNAQIKGKGIINIYAIHNRDSIKLDDSRLELLASVSVDSPEEYDNYECDFYIPNNAEVKYEQQWEGMGDKIMGIKVEYSEGLYIKGISIKKE